MNRKPIYIGNTSATYQDSEVEGELVTTEGEIYYKISNSDQMRPFFMSLVSNSNHWMFISSNGGLSAGRKNADHALFPYYTDDKITDSSETTGSKTMLQVYKDDKVFLWEPFSERYQGIYTIKRNLYKNRKGNKLIFEEQNLDLDLTFKYHWNTSNKFGFVKKSALINNAEIPIKVTVLDGIQNIMPYGVGADLQNDSSNLVDAYKKSELEVASGLGIFALSAIIVDKAEPSEALKSNTVWSIGLPNPTYLLSSLQLNKFRRGEPLVQETDIKAEKGAYFISSDITLKPNDSANWIIVANVNQSLTDIVAITEKLKNKTHLEKAIQEDIDEGTKHLLELANASDAMQLSRNKLRNTRHFANTVFNIMRGGIFDHNYEIEKTDFVAYIANANKKVFKKKGAILEQLPKVFHLGEIKAIAEKDEDKNFQRLCFEYLPLKFSRRHGDPSRPWNKFSINTRSENDGSKILDYEGNWRDIFQNWEALAHSYPEFMESMIHKFLNASTFDGYNPYRITKGGFDWEVIEEDDPWSYIGYWGDHQIIYLLKFLEFIEDHYPGRLASYDNQNLFVYANVPYRIKKYEDILKNSKDTIDFDYDLDARIQQKREELGVDGALLRDQNYFIHKVNLMEKLLVTVLAKLSNFIPEGGIWLNTQRPEWNDANNALVGNGVSMVTLYHLRRFLKFFDGLSNTMDNETIEVSIEVSDFFYRVVETFNKNKHILTGKISDTDRKAVLDGLGNAGSDYRNLIYENAFSSDKGTISKTDLSLFFEVSLEFLEHSINANKRSDNLFHSYNLMTVENEAEISLSHLPEMLEGQVAVLSSGYISGESSLELLNALRSSALFRPDQYSYLLYPDKELPRFTQKNNIPNDVVEKSQLLKLLVKENNKQILEQDLLGTYHFNGNFNNAESLKKALSELEEEKYSTLIEKDRQHLLDTFEKMFDHKSFTGRSGTFFGYEGLGSIYWHMVSKLLLSVQETCLLAVKNKESEVTIGKLLEHYYEINEGLGVHKSPKLYGAFPTDPYSHTPAGKGAQQPGMTGQVKEDILSRFGELGVFVKQGMLQFNPRLLRTVEFLKDQRDFNYVDINREAKTLVIEKDALCFTYCQIPIIYKLSNTVGITVKQTNGDFLEFDSLQLDVKTTKMVFERLGKIEHIYVRLDKQKK